MIRKYNIEQPFLDKGNLYNLNNYFNLRLMYLY